MDVTGLEDIGLTGSEIKVFLSLIRLGSSKAGLIIDESGLQNPVVHRAFHSLIRKGLITYSIEGKTKYYHAIDPRLLLNIIEEKKQHLEKLIPELIRVQVPQKGKTKVNVHQGIRGIRELFNLLLESCDKDFLTYGAPGKSLRLLGEYFWDNFHDRRIKKKIESRMIFDYSLKQRAKKLNRLGLSNVRTTDVEFEELVETVIAGDMVAIIIYLENPVGILIDEPLASRSYKKFFEILWKNSAEVG